MSSPKTETLLDCPKCGTTGFTARGLKAHRCTGKPRNGALTIPGFTAPVAVNEKDFTAAIREDLAVYECNTRLAAFAAIRNGLRLIWVRDNGVRGDLTRIIKASSNKSSERTLYNHLAAAERFATEAGLLDNKTQKLKDGKKLAPITETQLELFSDPKAKFDGALKKLLKWVGERGLTDLYRQETKLKATKTIQKTGPAPVKTLAQLEEDAENELTGALNSLDAWFLAEHHTRVKPASRETAIALLEGAIQKMRRVKA